MRFAIDNNLSPDLADLLSGGEIEADHVRELADEAGNLRHASDARILATARVSGRIVLTADTDFGDLLRESGDAVPSVVRVVTKDLFRPVDQAERLLVVLPTHAVELAAGSLLTVHADRVRVAMLPLRPRARTDDPGEQGSSAS